MTPSSFLLVNAPASHQPIMLWAQKDRRNGSPQASRKPVLGERMQAGGRREERGKVSHVLPWLSHQPFTFFMPDVWGFSRLGLRPSFRHAFPPSRLPVNNTVFHFHAFHELKSHWEGLFFPIYSMPSQVLPSPAQPRHFSFLTTKHILLGQGMAA